jgi:hypothetical protein
VESPLWCLAVATVVGECGVAHLSHHTRASCPSEPAEGAQSVTAEKLRTAPGVAVASSLKWGGLTGIPVDNLRHLVGTQQAHRKSRHHTHQEFADSVRLPEGVAHGTICNVIVARRDRVRWNRACSAENAMVESRVGAPSCRLTEEKSSISFSFFDQLIMN